MCSSKLENCTVDSVALGYDNLHKVKGKGDIPMKLLRNRVNKIKSVLYVPGIDDCIDFTSNESNCNENCIIGFDKRNV